jgi:hypothetical protein
LPIFPGRLGDPARRLVFMRAQFLRIFSQPAICCSPELAQPDRRQAPMVARAYSSRPTALLIFLPPCSLLVRARLSLWRPGVRPALLLFLPARIWLSPRSSLMPSPSPSAQPRPYPSRRGCCFGVAPARRGRVQLAPSSVSAHPAMLSLCACRASLLWPL